MFFVFNECFLVLYLWLLYDIVSLWVLYYFGDEIRFEKMVWVSINELFRRLEVMYGYVLIFRVFGYIMVGKYNWSVICFLMINFVKY